MEQQLHVLLVLLVLQLVQLIQSLLVTQDIIKMQHLLNVFHAEQVYYHVIVQLQILFAKLDIS